MEQRPFPWGLVFVLVMVLSLGVCFCYYIIWILFEYFFIIYHCITALSLHYLTYIDKNKLFYFQHGRPAPWLRRFNAARPASAPTASTATTPTTAPPVRLTLQPNTPPVLALERHGGQQHRRLRDARPTAAASRRPAAPSARAPAAGALDAPRAARTVRAAHQPSAAVVVVVVGGRCWRSGRHVDDQHGDCGRGWRRRPSAAAAPSSCAAPSHAAAAAATSAAVRGRVLRGAGV